MSGSTLSRSAARTAFNSGGWVTAGASGKAARVLSDGELTDTMMDVDNSAVIVPVQAGTDTRGWKKLALADLVGADGPNSMRNRKPFKPVLEFGSQVRDAGRGRKRTFDESNQSSTSVQLRKEKPESTKRARTDQDRYVSRGRKRTFDESNQSSTSVQLRKEKPESTKRARTDQDRYVSRGRKRTFTESNESHMTVQLRKEKPESTKRQRTNQWDALAILADQADKAKDLPTICQNAWDGKLKNKGPKSSLKTKSGWAKVAATPSKTLFVPHGVIDHMKVVGATYPTKTVSWKEHLTTWCDAQSRSPSPSPPPASRGSWWSDDDLDQQDAEAMVVGAMYGI